MINFVGKAITLRSSDGPDVTTIDGTGLNDSVVKCISGEGSDTVLEGFTITGGTGDTSTFRDAVGGGMFNLSSSPTVASCVFTGNVVSGSGGGMACYYNSNPAVINCCFAGNAASAQGGGLYLVDSDVMVVNCSITANTADTYGGGMACYDSMFPALVNCIVWGNSAEYGPQMSLMSSEHPSSLAVSYSNAEGGQPAVHVDEQCALLWGPGNLDADPLFVDPDNGDCRLTGGSPCIDAGDNTGVPPDGADLDGDGDTTERTPIDLDGSVRFVDDLLTDDTGVPDPPDYPEVVDMGAFEFQSPFILGDLNCDGLVNFFDIDPFVMAITMPSQYDIVFPDCNRMLGDCNGDGYVDFFDIDAFVALIVG